VFLISRWNLTKHCVLYSHNFKMPPPKSSLHICLLPYTLVAIRDIMAAPSAQLPSMFFSSLCYCSPSSLLCSALCSLLKQVQLPTGPRKRKEGKIRRIFSPILSKILNSQGFLSFNLPRVKRHYVSRVILSNNKLRETTPLTTWNRFDEQKEPGPNVCFYRRVLKP